MADIRIREATPVDVAAMHYPVWRQSFHLDGRTPDWESAPGVKVPHLGYRLRRR